VPASIEVRERSTVPLSKSDYRALEESDVVLELVGLGVLSLVRSRATPFGVRSGSLVGESVIGSGQRLVVREKVAGSLQALLRWAVPRDFRAAPSPTFVDADSPVLEVFAARFLDLLSRHLQRGRIKEYGRLREQSSRPRGRIDVRRTMQLRSRGIATRVDHHRTVLHADILLNRLLALGLHAVESYVTVAGASAALMTRARSYAALFDDVDVLSLQRESRGAKSGAFESALADPRTVGDISDALSYARALVLNLGAWPLTEDHLVPESYFLNLETLFEDAVRQVAREVALGVEVTRGAQLQRPLFVDRDAVYVADPDIVMSSWTGTAIVADCKYKDLKGLPDHGDVYQLVAHAQAFGSTTGVLIYPGISYAFEPLGTTIGGVTVAWATVRISQLDDDMVLLMKDVVPGA